MWRMTSHILWKIKNVRNHQPAIVLGCFGLWTDFETLRGNLFKAHAIVKGQSNGYSWHFSTGFINIILNTVSIQSLKGNFARILLYRDILYISIISWIAGFITPNCFIIWTVKFTFSFVKSTFSSVESLFLLVKSPLVLVESLFLLIQSPFLG
jgi:hypothetical protein